MELSVIIPVLNEADTLPALFRTLAFQAETDMETVLCDGGSSDGTVALAERLAGEAPFPVRVITAAAGRARQLNAGAAAAGGDSILFLHADSLFIDRLAFRKGLDRLAARSAETGTDRVAGRFALRFHRQNTAPSRGYYHYECKARLDRKGCTHGDQGFLLRRSFFDAVGSFDGSVPMLAETRFAEAVRAAGQWFLLPAEVHTSARRFEIEGLRERQTLNAVISNFAAAGWEVFFREFSRLYANHDDAGRLDLVSFLRETDRLMATLPLRQRLRLWYDTGRFVRDNAWQLALARDTARGFRQRLPPGVGDMRSLTCYDSCLDRLTDHLPGRVLAAFLTWLWLRWNCQVA